MSKRPILIVIPYLASAAQGREIEYAIAGWRKHFKEEHSIFREDYRIVLTGEGLPRFKGRDISYVESKRVPAVQGQYRQHLDYVSCLKKVRKRFPDSEGFIMVADDCFAVNDFSMADIQFLKAKSMDIDYDPMTPNAWRQDAIKTAKALHAAGLPTHDYTTHLPQWFEWSKLETLWAKYDMEHQSYVIEDLYYNTYFADRIPFILSETSDNLKLTVTQNAPSGAALDMALRRKVWINSNADGWRPELQKLLADHFGM
jgi:hypothetical protein